jgi:capsular polysaccharide biosynthesis protein
MRIEEYLNIIRRRWWIVALVTITAVVAAYGFSKLRTPIFRSQAAYTMLVNRADSGAFMFADRLLAGYVHMVYNADKLQAISDQLGIDQSGDFLMEYVRVQPQPAQMQIVIEADYYDPETARRLAAAVGDTLSAVVVENNRTLQGEDRINIYQSQSAKAAWKAKPNTRVNVLAGALLGAVVGLLLAFVLESLDDSLKSSADVERFAGLTTIGAIPASAWDAGRSRGRLRPLTASGLAAGAARPQAPTTQKRR